MSTPGLSSETLFELKLLFLRELSEGYRSARQAHEALLHNPTDAKAQAEVKDFFHRIAGFASRVGMPVLGQLAAVCERAVDLAREQPSGSSSTALVHLLADGLKGVAETLDEHGSGASERPLPAQKQNIEGLSVTDALGEGRELSKVLVIDDDEFSAGLIDSTLRAAGFISSYCCNPSEAIAKIEEELPDLIVMDVMMPEVDGFELCRRVRAHPAMQFTPILFVTRKGDVDQRVRGLEVGANDYIPKPFEPKELVARVRSHLQRLSILREMAIRDGLTRCYNHKYFKDRLEQEVARAARYGHPLSIAMLDIDHFKRINDDFGHVRGDQVLANMAMLISACVRTTDVVARYGGEEFGIIMVQAGTNEAQIICNRIRERVAQYRFSAAADHDRSESGIELTLTVSIGVAQYLPTDQSATSLIRRADEALYGAKAEGRNALRLALPTAND